MLMKRTVVHYKTKPESANENQRLIADVFRELQAKAPDGVRYAVLRTDDGTFVHIVSLEDGAVSITALDAFASFQRDIDERCAELPNAGPATIVGNYRMLAEPRGDG
jgi:hypothetical protein